MVIVPENPARGLDPHQGTVTLFDGETGQTIAVMNASPITAIRTAAVSALATRELAREDARALAIVGAGHQAKAHLEALVGVRPFDDIRIASRTHAKAEELAEQHPAARAVSAEEAVRGADVITTVTSSADPVLAREWVADGAHINAVGACFPNTRELDSDTVAASTFIADRRESAENESGDYRLALADGAIGEGHIAAELGDVLTGNARRPYVGRRDHGLRVAGRRGRGPLRGRVRLPPRAGDRPRASPPTFDSDRRDSPGGGRDRRRGTAHAARACPTA